MQRRALLSLLLSLPFGFVSTKVMAQVDGPQASFEDNLIAQLEGNWLLTRKIRGTEVQNQVSAKWVLNHQFLQVHMKDVKEPPAYEAIVLIGYIHATKEYVAHWVDTYGGRFSAVGRGTRTANAIEFKFAYPDGPFFNTFTWNPDTKQWIFRLESQDSNGGRQLFALDTLVRQQ